MKTLFTVLFAMFCIVSVQGAELVGFTVETTRGRNEKVRVRREVPVQDGRAVFRWPRAEIPADATCVEVFPDFAVAEKG